MCERSLRADFPRSISSDRMKREDPAGDGSATSDSESAPASEDAGRFTIRGRPSTC